MLRDPSPAYSRLSSPSISHCVRAHHTPRDGVIYLWIHPSNISQVVRAVLHRVSARCQISSFILLFPPDVSEPVFWCNHTVRGVMWEPPKNNVWSGPGPGCPCELLHCVHDVGIKQRFTVPEDFTPRKPPPEWEILSRLPFLPLMNFKRR